MAVLNGIVEIVVFLEIVHDTQEIILKKFSEIFHHFGHDVIFTPIKALFEYFEQIFADLRLFLQYNMDITP